MGTRSIAVVAAACAVAACTPKPAPGGTAFLQTFSLDSAAARAAGPVLAVTQSDNGSGAALAARRYDRDFDIIYTVTDPASFDEGAFIARLAGEIHRGAASAGVRIAGAYQRDSRLSLTYAGGGYVGSLDVFGWRTASGTYELRGAMHEFPVRAAAVAGRR